MELETKSVDELLRKSLVLIKKLKEEKEAASFSEPIAIIGVSCRFPGGVKSPDDYWQLLIQGKEGIVEPPKERWSNEDYYDPNPEAPNKMYVKELGFLSESVRAFDAKLFGISPREAEEIDPQHRLLLELSWEALESASINPDALKGSKTGVFIGIGGSEYAIIERDPDQISPYTLTGSTAHMASGRISHCFGLHGPSLSIDTACSSSLVSLHEACKSLQNKECSLALIGGVNLMITPSIMVSLCKLKALSKDGRCKAFDKDGDGYGRAEGGGILVLKRLKDAIDNQDQVLAVIKGSAINHDGPSSGLTVPNMHAQVELIKAALSNANMSAEAISYLEAHGTGTALGDPIELQAVELAYGKEAGRKQPLIIGTCKTNVGHLEAAAGIAGVIKVVQCLKHKMIPPHINFKELNPRISLERIPAYLPLNEQSWTSDNGPLTAGVSSFGFSGTNAHIILQEYQAPSSLSLESKKEEEVHLPLSAKSKKSLDSLALRYKDFLEQLNENDSLKDVQTNLLLGRSHQKHRLVISGSNRQELIANLQNYIDGKENGKILYCDSSQRLKNVLLINENYLTEEQISHFYQAYPVFKTHFVQCFNLFPTDDPLDIKANFAQNQQSENTPLKEISQFCANYAFLKLLQHFGWTFHSFAGLKSGFYISLVLCEIISLEDAVRAFMQKVDSSNQSVKVMINAKRSKYRLLDPISGNTLQLENMLTVEILAGYAYPYQNLSAEKMMENFKQELNLPLIPRTEMQLLLSKRHECIDLSGNLVKALLTLHAKGMNFDWSSVLNTDCWKKISLPTYAFDQEKYWLPDFKGKQQATVGSLESFEDPLLAQRIQSPLEIQQYRFKITDHNLPEIEDTHRILHVGYIMKMFLSIAKEAFGYCSTEVSLRDLTFERALYVDQTPYNVFSIVTRDNEKSSTIHLMTQKDDQKEWTTHVSGSLVKNESAVTAKPLEFYLNRVVDSAVQPLQRADFYKFMSSKGICLGKSVKWVDKAWKYNNCVISTLSLEDGTTPFELGIFDAIAQLFHLFLDHSEAAVKLMAVKWQESQLLTAQAKGPYTCVIESSLNDSQSVVADAFLYGGNNKLIFVCKGLRTKKLDAGIPSSVGEGQDALVNAILSTNDEEIRKSKLIEYLKGLLAQLLKAKPEDFSAEERLYNIGFDSIVGMKFKHSIDSALKCSLSMEVFFQNPSIEEIAATLQQTLELAESKAAPAARKNEPKNLWFKNLIKDPSLPSLFCFPYGGGGASEYMSWIGKLAASLNVIPVQLPGREERLHEQPESNIHELTHKLCDLIQEMNPKSYAFYGHSMGALVAYNVAKEMKKRGHTSPSHLFLGAYSAPNQLPNPWLQVVKQKLKQEDIPMDSKSEESSSPISMEAIFPYLMKEYEEISQLNEDYAKQIIPTLWADLLLVDSFEMQSIEPIDIPITAFSGQLDDRVTKSEVEEWQGLTSANFKHYMMPGDHFFIKSTQQQKDVMGIICEVLEIKKESLSE